MGDISVSGLEIKVAEHDIIISGMDKKLDKILDHIERQDEKLLDHIDKLEAAHYDLVAKVEKYKWTAIVVFLSLTGAGGTGLVKLLGL